MLKTLLHKNWQEVGAFYFRDKKNGGKAQGNAKVGLIALYAFVYVSLAASFAGMSDLFFSVVPEGETWIVWAIMGILGIAMSALINAITCYAQLFLARDNEMLLSMPIKPGTIMLSRMVDVYVLNIVYVSLAWLPTMIVGFVKHKMAIPTIGSQILMLLVQSIVALAFTCFFGWIVAYFSSKFKNQKFITVIVCLLFLGAIYVLQFKTNSLLNALASNIGKAGSIIKAKAYPFYLLGKATCGDIISILLFMLMAAILLALAYLLLSKTFIKMSTTKAAGTKVKFKENQIKTSSVSTALLNKERIHFVNSVTCMLNAGIGVIFMLVGSIFLFIKGEMIAEKIAPLIAIPEIANLLPLAIIVVICMMESLGTISAASVSLEGKNIWMLHSLPIDPLMVLNAKIQFAVYLQAIPGALLAIALSNALGLDSTNMVILAVFAAFFGRISATYGTILNLKHPNLEWTSEQTPVKQGAPVAILLFGGWAVGLVAAAVGYFAIKLIPTYLYIFILVVIMGIIYTFFNKWIRTRGVEIFSYL